MDWGALLAFMGAVGVGSYFQALTGFAMGMFMMPVVVVLNVTSVATAAAALNILMLCNTGVALSRTRHLVEPVIARQTLTGVVPGTIGGVLLLAVLSVHYAALLRLLLGLLVVAGGLVLVARPQAAAARSTAASFTGAGVLAGVLGGLFSVPAPPVVYHFYRQPYPVPALRATMLAVFATIGGLRLLVVGVQGGIDREVLRFGLLSVPVVVLASWLCVRFPPPLTDTVIRRMAFVTLVVMGGFITVAALFPANGA